VPVSFSEPLALQGRGTAVAKRRQGEGTPISDEPVGRALTPALRANPLPLRERGYTLHAGLASALLLAGCAATQSAAAVQPQAPGFLLGLWHGFIFPVAWIVSLFVSDVSVYAVPNNGGWYDFGYFLGIVVFGVGARKSAIEIHGARRTSVRTGTTTIHHEEGR
jgi:hypothetical protein